MTTIACDCGCAAVSQKCRPYCSTMAGVTSGTETVRAGVSTGGNVPCWTSNVDTPASILAELRDAAKGRVIQGAGDAGYTWTIPSASITPVAQSLFNAAVTNVTGGYVSTPAAPVRPRGPTTYVWFSDDGRRTIEVVAPDAHVANGWIDANTPHGFLAMLAIQHDMSADEAGTLSVAMLEGLRAMRSRS